MNNIIAFILLFFTFSSNAQQQKSTIYLPGWKLVWADEFNVDGLPDAMRWNYDTAYNKEGWGNNELQWYTAGKMNNTFAKNGILNIVANKEIAGTKNYSSGRISTKNKAEWKYGKIEVRAKLPKGRGTWPAIWMLPTQNKYGGWPKSGEIDLMEHVGYLEDSIFSTTHTDAFNHVKKTQVGDRFYLPTANTSFHVYGMEWDSTQMVFSVDDKAYFVYKNDGNGFASWPFDEPFYLILNLAIGGNWGGTKGVDNLIFPQQFQVDYVRVYQKELTEEIIQRPTFIDSSSNVNTSQQIITNTSEDALLIKEPQNGVLSVNSTSFSTMKGWRKANFYTGQGLVAFEEGEQNNFVQIPITIKESGNYNLFVLGNRKRNAAIDQNMISVSVKQDAVDSQQKVTLLFNELNATSWTSTVLGSYNNANLFFDAPGNYLLNISAIKGTGMYFEKIVLANNGYKPTGSGPEQTVNNKSVYLSGFDSMVVLPPQWAFGVLYGGYTNQEISAEVVNKLIGNDFPIDAYWVDSWIWDFANKGKGPAGYLSFKEDIDAFPNIQKMWSDFEKKKVKAGIWIWDCIHQDGNESTFDSFKTKGFFSATFLNKDRWHNKTGQTITGNINFENEDAAAYWKMKLKTMFDKGLDFLKLDRSSAIPFSKTAFEATQQFGRETKGRGFILSHLHSTYDKRHKLYPTKWSGDAKITWTQPDYPDNSIYAMGGYKENIGMVADPKRTTYEIPFLTHDAGGYDFFGSNELSDELYARWIQFASFNSILTIFTQHTNTTKNLPYYFSTATQQIFKKYTHLRMKLFPYIYTYALQTRMKGKKMVTGDEAHPYQYLFGDAFLVAPVYEKGKTSQQVYFPAGTWYDFENDNVFEGSQFHTVTAPIDKLPLFVKKGSIIPMRDYQRSIELGNNNRLTLDIFPKDSVAFELLEDDGTSNDYLQGAILSTSMHMNNKAGKFQFIIEPSVGKYKGMRKKREWVLQFHNIETNPQKILINNKKVNFNYSPEKKWLTVKVKQKINKRVVCQIQ